MALFDEKIQTIWKKIWKKEFGRENSNETFFAIFKHNEVADILNNLDYGVRLRDNDPEVSLIRFVLNSRILISIHSAFVTFEKTEIP